MAIFSLAGIFRGLINPIFIKQEGTKNVFADVVTDFNLSRSLYTGIPDEKQESGNMQLGNFCTKAFINTFSWYIGIPAYNSNNTDFTTSLNTFTRRQRSSILRVIQQTLVDGRHFIWMRIEEVNGKAAITLKQIPRECVLDGECTKNPSGGYDKFVFEVVEKWKIGTENKTATIKRTIEKTKESWEITGDLPSEYATANGDAPNSLDIVPVFCQINNKQPYMNEGIPEIAPVVPFIQRYDATMRKLGKHVDDGLVPRLTFRVKKMVEFLVRSFGVTKENIDSGKIAISGDNLQNVFIDEPTDEVKYLQKEDRSPSALKVLELLFYIITEMTMPEYLYGSAMNSTNASVSEQSPVWEKKVDGKQGEFDEFFYWIADTYLYMINKIAGLNKFGTVENIEIKWPEVTAKDDVAMMTAFSNYMAAIEKALTLELVSMETAFNALKTFIPVSGDFETEQEKAKEFTRVKLEVENIRARMNEGDIDVGGAMNNLFGKKKTA